MKQNFCTRRGSISGMDSNLQNAVLRLVSVLIALTVLLTGCAGQPQQEDTDAIADFIAVAELESLDVVRLGFVRHWNFKQLNEEYIVLKVRDDYYLVEFRRRCRELNRNYITPDKRYDSSALRAGIDTIRGCIIERMFAIDKGQAEELEHIGKEP